MIRGVTIGKFLPPHLGHSYLLKTASAQCDELHVIICDRPEWHIPAELRKHWLESMHPDVKFHIVKDSLDDYDSPGWAKATIGALGFVPDIAFTSEDYGKFYAKAIGCRHKLIDKARARVPISATAVRANPWSTWEYIHPLVRAYFVRRICLVGPESTGKTTLAQMLAEHYATAWVPEYAREYTIKNKERLSKTGFLDEDYIKIARGQNRSEDKLAEQANKLLFCDTNAFAVSVWYDCHEKLRSAQLEALAVGRSYTMYLLCDTDVAFVDDGVRIGKAFREAVYQRYQQKLQLWDEPYVIVSGSPEERFGQATDVIDRIMQGRAVQLPGLIRNGWPPGAHF